MWSGLAAFFAGMFSSTKMQDTAVDAVRKLGGLDEMSAKDKAEFLLQYIDRTKYQSPVRRLIALMLTMVYLGVIMVWLISSAVGYYFDNMMALEHAGAVRIFMESVLTQPFNILLSFYFVTNIVSKIGK